MTSLVKQILAVLWLTGLLVLSGTLASAETRSLRLVSAPDLINADVEHNAPRCFDMDEDDPDYAARKQVIIDARTLARQSKPQVRIIPEHPHDVNNDGILSIQEGYRGGMQDMLEAIAAERPDAFLAAGDLVDGEWATQAGKANSNSSLAVKQQHIRDQGDIYYDAYFQNFADAGFDGPIFAVIGDHEIGDNNWDSAKIALVPTFIDVYQQKFQLPTTIAGDGAYVDTPFNRFGRWWAKKLENVLLVGIETFDVRYNGAGEISAILTDSYNSSTKRILIPQDHLDWIDATLATANADPDIDHIIVMGHSPVDTGNVRVASSSSLLIGGGTSSALWQIFENRNVDLYLAGEVHAVSGYKHNGVTQLVTAGNQFSSAESNYLIIDVYSDRILLTLKEAFKTVNGQREDAGDPINDDNSKSSEWRARHPYRVVATATLYKGGAQPALVEETGQFLSFINDTDDSSDPISIPSLTIDPDPVPEPVTSTLPSTTGLERLSVASLSSNTGTHPGVAMTLKPARNSVVLFAAANQWGNEFSVEPIVVNGRQYELQPLASSRAANLTTFIYGAEIGHLNEETNITLGASLTTGRQHASYAVQLGNATLAGFGSHTQRADSGSDKPVIASFSGFDTGTFVLTIAGCNSQFEGLVIDSGLADLGAAAVTTRNGLYQGGSGFFDNSTTTEASWNSVSNFKGAGLASVAINAVPDLSLQASAQAGTLTASWHSATGPNTLLEVSTDLSVWQPAPGSPSLKGTDYEIEVQLLPGESRSFYRLNLD